MRLDAAQHSERLPSSTFLRLLRLTPPDRVTSFPRCRCTFTHSTRTWLSAQRGTRWSLCGAVLLHLVVSLTCGCMCLPRARTPHLLTGFNWIPQTRSISWSQHWWVAGIRLGIELGQRARCVTTMWHCLFKRAYTPTRVLHNQTPHRPHITTTTHPTPTPSLQMLDDGSQDSFAKGPPGVTNRPNVIATLNQLYEKAWDFQRAAPPGTNDVMMYMGCDFAFKVRWAVLCSVWQRETSGVFGSGCVGSV